MRVTIRPTHSAGAAQSAHVSMWMRCARQYTIVAMKPPRNPPYATTPPFHQATTSTTPLICSGAVTTNRSRAPIAAPASVHRQQRSITPVSMPARDARSTASSRPAITDRHSIVP